MLSTNWRYSFFWRICSIDFGVPKSESVDGFVVVADNRHVVRDSHNGHCVFVDEFQRAVGLLLHVSVAVEFDVDGFVGLAIFPSETVAQPVVGNFNLLTLNDFLFEETVLITDGAAVTGQTVSRERIDKARRQTTETAVAETCVGFFLINVVEVQVEVFEDFAEG